MREYDKVLHELAEHRRQMAMSQRKGSVHEVDGDNIRVVMGIRPDGKPWLSPWLSTTDHRGGSRERRQYQKGQNVRVSAVGGDFANATVTHHAPGTSFPPPDHADDINGDTFQAGKLRTSKNQPSDDSSGGGSGGSGGSGSSGSSGGSDHFHDVWIAEEDNKPPAHQDQSNTDSQQSGSGSGSQQKSGGQQQKNSGTAAMKSRVSESGGITHRVGKDDSAARLAATTKGVKMRNKSFAIFIDDQGIWSTHPIQQKPDTVIPNDNK
jgi:hypothetical protein